MRAVQFATHKTRSVARQGQVWCWALVLSLLLAQSLGAWHRVAHAAQLDPLGPDTTRSSSVASTASTASEDGAAAWLQHGLDELFAHHFKAGGHLDCAHLDQASHGAGPSAAPMLPLLDAPLANVLLPGASQRLASQEGRAFDARGPPRRT